LLKLYIYAFILLCRRVLLLTLHRDPKGKESEHKVAAPIPVKS